MKKFVRIQQTFTLQAIMDVEENETDEDIARRVKEHCKANGGAETVICCGGDITAQVYNGATPTIEDEESYECID